jgi:3-(3-hydroxy-phenyl)propionate hydroxylase
MPDLDLVTPDGRGRVFELLQQARPVLLELGGPRLDAGAWSLRVKHVVATHDGGWELPVVGEVAAPSAVLVRPDGHVAWVGEGSADGLPEALSSWCGAPRR